MKPSEAVSALASALVGVREHLPALDNAKEARETAEANLKATREQLAAANTALEEMSTKAQRAEADLEKKLSNMQNENAFTLQSQQKSIETARKTLADLDAEIASKRTAHDQILASLESIKKRLV